MEWVPGAKGESEGRSTPKLHTGIFPGRGVGGWAWARWLVCVCVCAVCCYEGFLGVLSLSLLGGWFRAVNRMRARVSVVSPFRSFRQRLQRLARAH